MIGYLIVQARLIFQPVVVPDLTSLLYVEFFNFSNTLYTIVNNICVVCPTPRLEMFVVQC
jgi:hypothetical protein